MTTPQGYEYALENKNREIERLEREIKRLIAERDRYMIVGREHYVNADPRATK